MELYIEQLQEMGKAVLTGNEDIEELQNELLKLGFDTTLEVSDREYLVLVG